MSKLNKKIIDKEAFLLYKDSLDILDKLSDEQSGKLFKAIYCFQTNQTIPELDFVLDLLFTNFRNQFIRDNKAYAKKIEDKSYNGRIGNLKRWNAELYQKVEQGIISLEVAEEIHKKNKSLSDEIIAQRQTVSLSDEIIADSDIDNVIVPEPVPEIDNEPVPEIDNEPVPEIDNEPVPEIDNEPVPEIDNEPVIDNNQNLKYKTDFSQFDFSLFMSGDEKKDIERRGTLLRILNRNYKQAQAVGTSYLDFVVSIQSHLYDRHKKGEDVFAAINNTISSGIKTILAPKEPYVQLTPEERKKQKEEQLKKEERNNILSNYCRGVTYDEAMTQLNKDKKDRMRHFPFKPQEVITKLECDKYGIVYPTKRQWDIFNTAKERFLLKAGGFTEGDCK